MNPPPDNLVQAAFDQQLGAAIEAFRGRFGRLPRFGASASGRVNLIGEHTDYNQGFVLPMAIDRRTIVLADPVPPNITQSTIWAIDLDETVQVDLTRPLERMPGTAANYVLGVVRQFIEHQRAARSGGAAVPNLDMAITSTVPIGAGLASSAALEVTVATVLEEVTGTRLAPLDKALMCQAAEHAFPGTPCGIMDMYTVAFASAGHALLIDCRSNTSQPVPMPDPSEVSVLIIDTGVKHELAGVGARGGAYAERRAACERAARKLGVESLRDATVEMIRGTSGLDHEERRRALHVVAENARTILAAEALTGGVSGSAGGVERFGEFMFASHDSLRDLFEVSCPELDVLVDAARSLRGAGGGGGVFGARMTGGGFGGCVVVLCAADRVPHIQAQLERAFIDAFGRPPAMFTTNAAAGARAMALGS